MPHGKRDRGEHKAMFSVEAFAGVLKKKKNAIYVTVYTSNSNCNL
jgi:hypothetical protein